MPSRAATLAVLSYLVRASRSASTVRPLLILDEGLAVPDDPVLGAHPPVAQDAAQEERSVGSSPQSLADIAIPASRPPSSGAARAASSCPTRRPSSRRSARSTRASGLNVGGRSIVAQATPKRDYYYRSRLGNRVFDLGLGPYYYGFAGAS